MLVCLIIGRQTHTWQLARAGHTAGKNFKEWSLLFSESQNELRIHTYFQIDWYVYVFNHVARYIWPFWWPRILSYPFATADFGCMQLLNNCCKPNIWSPNNEKPHSNDFNFFNNVCMLHFHISMCRTMCGMHKNLSWPNPQVWIFGCCRLFHTILLPK